jgi:hypothetical protein
MNKDLTNVLQQLNSITNTVILKHPITVAASEAKDIYVHLDISQLDTNAFPDIGLNDNLNNYLNLYKLFDDNRTVSFKGDTVEISSGDITSSYITDNVALMEAYDISPEQFQKTEEVPTVCSIDLTVDDIKKLKSATGVFKDLSEIIIKCQDSEVSMSLGATNKFNARDNSYKIRKNTSATKEFEIKIPVENFKKLPESEYTFEVKYNESRDAYRILLKNKALSGLKLIMSVIK